MAANNNYNYTFTFSLLDVGDDPNTGMRIVYSGTFILNVADPMVVTGAITFDSYFTKVIDFQGTATQSFEDTGTLINASGSSSEAQINLAFIFNDDGEMGNDSLLGGMTTIYDVGAEESNLYIIQGVAPQGPF